MDCSVVIQSLDSLWFFSNVLSSKTQQPSHVVVDECAVKEEEETSKPMNQVEEIKQQDEFPCAESLVPRCPRCGDFAPELEGKVTVQQVESAEPKEEKRSASSRRKRRSKRSFRERRKVLGELDLGFDHRGNMDYWFLVDEETSTGQQQIFGNQYHDINMKMPPLDDNIAMKEHLKSWAYAVACTVR